MGNSKAFQRTKGGSHNTDIVMLVSTRLKISQTQAVVSNGCLDKQCKKRNTNDPFPVSFSYDASSRLPFSTT